MIIVLDTETQTQALSWVPGSAQVMLGSGSTRFDPPDPPAAGWVILLIQKFDHKLQEENITPEKYKKKQKQKSVKS